jgi:di/tricarboxylate transporter
MSFDAYLTLAILGLAFALLIKTKIPPVAIFLGALTLTITFQLAPVNQCLKGFSNPGVMTIGILYMVAAGMYRTGAITLITEKLIGRPQSLLAAQMRILPPVALASAFLNNTPIVAMFIPVIRDLSRALRLEATRLYIPLSFSSILGGTCTLIGTATNLVVAGLVLDYLAGQHKQPVALHEIGMFDLTYIGVPITLAGIAFMILTSRVLLPAPRKSDITGRIKRLYSSEFVVGRRSRLIGKTLRQLGYIDSEGFELVSLHRSDGDEVAITPSIRLRPGDVLRFHTTFDFVPVLWDTQGLEPAYELQRMETQRYTHRLVEVVISPQSDAIGRKISELPLPDSPYRVSIIALSRRGQPVSGPLSGVRIEPGDDVILEVDEPFFNENLNEVHFTLAKRLTGVRFKRYDRALTATIITAAMVLVAALGWMSMLNVALLATGIMLLTGSMSLKYAGRSVDFSILIVIASAMGLEAAVDASGLAAKIAEVLIQVGGRNHYTAITMVFLGCIAMDTMVTNVASAVFMFPIAIEMASTLGVNGMPFVMTLMVGASCSFISPTGYQTNLMVYEPGSYRFSDFVKLGVPLTLVVGAITIILVPLIWQF